MKRNTLTLEDYLLIVQSDLRAVMARIRSQWVEGDDDPSIAAYKAMSALEEKHEAILNSVLLEDA